MYHFLYLAPNSIANLYNYISIDRSHFLEESYNSGVARVPDRRFCDFRSTSTQFVVQVTKICDKILIPHESRDAQLSNAPSMSF